MGYRGMSLNTFINKIMEALEEKPVVYRKNIDTESTRTKARNRLIMEWYVQQPYNLQKEVYKACMNVADSCDNIGNQGALELVVMTMVKYGKTV